MHTTFMEKNHIYKLLQKCVSVFTEKPIQKILLFCTKSQYFYELNMGFSLMLETAITIFLIGIFLLLFSFFHRASVGAQSHPETEC